MPSFLATHRLTLLDDSCAGLEDAIAAPLIAFNHSFMGPSGYSKLAIGISSADDGAIVGGLYGYSSYQWLFVQVLAVPESLRGRGWASRLLGMAEEQAVERGCVGVWLDTHNPDAKRKYEHLGYREFSRIDDYPPGHTKYLLRKRLGTGADDGDRPR